MRHCAVTQSRLRHSWEIPSANELVHSSQREAVSLPGIDEKLCLIFTARGRKVDHLKRCVWLLTQEDEYKVFKFPLLFWYRLAFLIQFCGAKRSDVMYLYEKFKKHGGRKK